MFIQRLRSQSCHNCINWESFFSRSSSRKPKFRILDFKIGLDRYQEHKLYENIILKNYFNLNFLFPPSLLKVTVIQAGDSNRYKEELFKLGKNIYHMLDEAFSNSLIIHLLETNKARNGNCTIPNSCRKAAIKLTHIY